MELRYPRSFLALLLVGFLIVALPLIAGLVSNAFSIEKLSEQSQKAVYNAAVATQNARQIAIVTSALERSGRYYATTGDRDVIETYKQSRESFNRLMAEFNALPLTPEMREAAETIQSRERGVFASLTQKSASAEFARQL
ncbi:MAG: hypothetical protein JNN20_12670, partial [Betaproteobacteria bacterium]|nr:hypothetical protein [Betaproteobacteria bacterium]